MHPRQAKLIEVAKAAATTDKTAAPILWRYFTPDGQTFYLEERRMTVRSPFDGKSFSARPMKMAPSQVGQAMREQSRTPDVEAPAMLMASADSWKA